MKQDCCSCCWQKTLWQIALCWTSNSCFSFHVLLCYLQTITSQLRASNATWYVAAFSGSRSSTPQLIPGLATVISSCKAYALTRAAYLRVLLLLQRVTYPRSKYFSGTVNNACLPWWVIMQQILLIRCLMNVALRYQSFIIVFKQRRFGYWPVLSVPQIYFIEISFTQWKRVHPFSTPYETYKKASEKLQQSTATVKWHACASAAHSFFMSAHLKSVCKSFKPRAMYLLLRIPLLHLKQVSVKLIILFCRLCPSSRRSPSSLCSSSLQ